MNRQLKDVMIFSNLNVIAFDENGEQIPEVQRSLATLLAEHIEKCGYKANGLIVETQWGHSWRLFRTMDGEWNHEVVTREATHDPRNAM